MSHKEHQSLPHAAPTTPRRLRSGTPFGETSSSVGFKTHPAPKSTPVVQAKKDTCSRKASKDGERIPSSMKSTSDTSYGLENHRCEERHLPSSCTHNSPKPKPQTLKAVLESIEPNSLSKNKSTTKRKTLRDLLNQKSFQHEKGNHCHIPPKKTGGNHTFFSKGKASSKSKGTYQEDRRSDEKNTPEMVHVFTSPSHSVRRRPDSAKSTCSSEHTIGSGEYSEFSHQAVVKRELPDDYWPMRNDYLDRDRSSCARVKTECFMKKDEKGASQTLRISCSKPEDTGSSHLTGPRTDVKPDIVLKVKPLSSSLLTLARAASDFYIASKKNAERSAKTEGHSEYKDVKARRSPTCSAPVLTPETDRNYCDSVLSTEDSNNESRQSKLSMILKERHTLANGEYPGHDQTNDDKTSDYGANHMHHFDNVLEESTLPPVANTVELLTEPHDYHHSNRSHYHVDMHGDDRQACLDGYESDSPGPPVLEPISLLKPEPNDYLDETSGTLGIKQEVNQEWSELDKDDDQRKSRTLHEKTEHSSSICVTGDQEGVHRLRPDRGMEQAAGKRDRAKEMGPSDEEDETGHLASADVAAQSEACSRRRRKGRPNRRARHDGVWSTSDLSASSQYDSYNYDDWDPTSEEKLPPSTPNTRRGGSRRQGETSSGSGRRGRKSIDLETLWANPQLDTHAFLLWASENRRGMQQQHPEASCSEVERLLSIQWRDVTFSSKLRFLCRARDAGTDHERHTVRKKKGPSKRRDTTLLEGRSVYEEFMRLPQERQKDLLRKWLRFYQKMLPRLEYQEFINDFKKGCRNLQLKPISARRKNARLRNLDPSHYKMLFEKIRETRPRVMGVYNKRKAHEEQLLRQSFHAMIRRLISGEPWPFVRGCRSKSLGELLKDIQQLEVEEALAQIDLPLPLSPAEVQEVMCKDPPSPILGSTPQTPTDSGECPRTRGAACRNSTTRDLLTSCAMMEPMGPSGDVDLCDSPFVLHVLEDLRHVADLPLLDQRCLDAVFLGPPTRVRTPAPRESQFQNSATYRRTMLYKHIQPLLDTRGLPLTSSPLYHSHPAQYFLQDDR